MKKSTRTYYRVINSLTKEVIRTYDNMDQAENFAYSSLRTIDCDIISVELEV